MNKVRVCDYLLDLYRINLYVIPERELLIRKFSEFMPDLMPTLDLCQYEWKGLVACCSYFYSHHLKTVPKFQSNCIYTWHETSNWDSNSSDNDSNPRDFYIAVDREMIKDAKADSIICYFKDDKN